MGQKTCFDNVQWDAGGFLRGMQSFKMFCFLKWGRCALECIWTIKQPFKRFIELTFKLKRKKADINLAVLSMMLIIGLKF